MSEAEIIRERLRSVVILRTGDGVGSGFYATSDGVIVTNKHVVGPYLSIKAQRFDRSQADVGVVRVARGYDLALLWDRSAALPPPIPLADPASIQPGDPVHAIGHPHGLDFTVTRGIVSSPARHVNGAYFVQTDAVAHPGSSGGPLLDAAGHVVGVSTFGMREDGLNFALGVRYVHELLGEMRVRPVAPGFRRCAICATKNSAARRSCRKCGADFSDQPLVAVEASPAPPPIQAFRAPASPEARDAEPTPESARAPDPFLARLEAVVASLDPAPADVTARGRTAHFTWKGCPISATVLRAGEPHVSVTAFVREVPAEEAASVMRRALEMNLSGAFEAKLGLRGSELYVAAERGMEAIDDVEIVALFRRVFDLRTRFLG